MPKAIRLGEVKRRLKQNVSAISINFSIGDGFCSRSLGLIHAKSLQSFKTLHKCLHEVASLCNAMQSAAWAAWLTWINVRCTHSGNNTSPHSPQSQNAGLILFFAFTVKSIASRHVIVYVRIRRQSVSAVCL